MKEHEENLDPNIVDELEEFYDDVEENYEEDYGDLTGTQYEGVKTEETLVDTAEGTVVDKKDLKPFDIIKAIAVENGYQINDPDDSCKTCYGRGYQGIEYHTQMPIPCTCIYPKKTPVEKANEEFGDNQRNPLLNRKPNRALRRRMALAFKNQIRRVKRVEQRNGERKEENEYSTRFVNKFVKKYIELSSIKKTASFFDLSLTETKKLLKDNKEKVEKTKKKLETTKGE